MIRLLSAMDVAAAVPMTRAIEVARRALEELSAGSIDAPLRPPFQLSEGATTLVMPGHRPESRDLAVKIVSIHPRNPARGLPTVHAIVVVIDTATGQPVGLVEGNTLTALRTGAAVGAATDLLARPDAHTIALFGAGVQARAALRAICAVRQIDEVRIISRSGASAERLAMELTEEPDGMATWRRGDRGTGRRGDRETGTPGLTARERGDEPANGRDGENERHGESEPAAPFSASPRRLLAASGGVEVGGRLADPPSRIVVARTPEEAIRGADVVVTATTSAVPVFEGSAVGPGTHVNAVGAFRPTERELDGDLVGHARIVVDTREGCLAEAGDLLIPLSAGQIDAGEIAELGEVSLGRRAGRTSAEEITLYKSVGHAALDVAMAGEAIRRAEELGLGRLVDL